MIILNNFELFQDDESNRYYQCLDGSVHWLTPKTETELAKYWLFNKYLDKVETVDMLNFDYGVDENDQSVIDMQNCHADIVEEFYKAVSSNDFEWLFVYKLFITHRESHNFPTL